jgi:hypothetical protein
MAPKPEPPIDETSLQLSGAAKNKAKQTGQAVNPMSVGATVGPGAPATAAAVQSLTSRRIASYAKLLCPSCQDLLPLLRTACAFYLRCLVFTQRRSWWVWHVRHHPAVRNPLAVANTNSANSTSDTVTFSIVCRRCYPIKGALARRQAAASHGVLAVTRLEAYAALMCTGCHAQMDPLGFSMESYDVIGGWRDRYRISPERGQRSDTMTLVVNQRDMRVALGPQVDASDTLADGRRFRDLEELKKLLLADKEQVTRGLATKLFIYATGQGLEVTDAAVVSDIVRNVKAENYGFRTLVHEIVQSSTFQTK